MANEAGQGCVVRGTSVGGYTIVSKGGPASTGGSVQRLAAYMYVNDHITPTKFNFYTASGDYLTSTESPAISLASGSTGESCYEWNAPGDFTAFSVNSGEYLGCFSKAPPVGNAQYYQFNSGAGMWYIQGDYSVCANTLFTLDTDALDALTADILAPVEMNMKINIGDIWRDVDSMKINIEDVWKDVIEMKINIGNVWKDIF